MKLLSINVRGLGGEKKWKYIKELIVMEKPGLLCVQETKLINVNASKCFSLWGSNDASWIHKGTDKEGRGILTMWDTKVFKCDRSVDGKGFVLVIWQYIGGESGIDVNVVVLNVYAPCSNNEKCCCGEKLKMCWLM